MSIIMTEGPEWKKILFFTLPLLIGNLLQQFYNIVDGIIVGNFVNQSALSAVGTCGPLTYLFIGVAIGMSVGSGILCAQLYGAKRQDDLRQAVSTALLLMLALGAILTLVGIAVSRPILKSVMGVPAAVLDDAASYFRIYCAGLIFSFLYNAVAAALRSVGDSNSSLYFLLISTAANILLDLLFVAVLHWSVVGAAWATVISQALAAAVSLVYMYRRHAILRFRPRELRFYRDKAALCVRLGIPTTIQQIAVSSGMLLIQRVINFFGEEMMAGMTAATKAYSILTAPTVAFNSAASTFAGQNIGAGRVDRVQRGLGASHLLCGGFCIVISVLVFVFADALVGLFGVTDRAMALGAPYIRMAAAMLPLFGVYMCTSGTYRGAGDVRCATAITLGGLVLRTAATYIMAFLTPLGPAALWWGLPFDWLSTFIVGHLRYRFGPWRKLGLVQTHRAAETE